MCIANAVIMTIAFAGLAACSNSSGPGGGGGGPVGSVTVGPGIEFVSRHGTRPATDTIAAGATVTWTWTGNEPHSVGSIGTPGFPSSATLTDNGTYAVRFDGTAQRCPARS